MDNQEAKFILRSFRHCGKDAQDPSFRQALEQAKADPELAAWFAKEREFDAAICCKLREISVPKDLRPFILTGQRVVQKKFRWRRFAATAGLALAACVVIGILSFVFMETNMPVANAVAFENVCNKAMNMTADNSFKHEYRSPEMGDIREWLKEGKNPSEFSLPVSMEALASVGCQVVNVQGQKMSIICFWLDEQKREAAHLFVVDRKAVKNLPMDLRFEKRGTVAAAVWSDANHAYVLTTHGNKESLRRFL